MKRKVVITGMGCLTPFGGTPEELCKNIDILLNKNYEDIHPFGFTGHRINNFKFYDDELLGKYPRLDLSCQYILHATKQALHSANITPEIGKAYRIGIIIGSTFGLLDSQEKFLKMLYRTGKGSPMYFQQTANNLLSGIIAYKYHITGFKIIFETLVVSITSLS